jgi:hypothetical protein
MQFASYFYTDFAQEKLSITWWLKEFQTFSVTGHRSHHAANMHAAHILDMFYQSTCSKSNATTRVISSNDIVYY